MESVINYCRKEMEAGGDEKLDDFKKLRCPSRLFESTQLSFYFW